MMGANSYILITGGAGFVGTNLAQHFILRGHSVLIYDNLSRPGVENNLKWLLSRYSDKISFSHNDIRNFDSVDQAVEKAKAVYHLAAQVAVTDSIVHPLHDFEVNARGTLNVLEALRARKNPPPLFYTSTNKVLGGLDEVRLVETNSRYTPEDEELRASGIDEKRSIDFRSPYGCSKGTADQYVLDYARIYGLSTVVFRMSCIYGPHQQGTEDQGWVAHFIKQALAGKAITIFGDGKQVRDALFIEDLIEAFALAGEHLEKTSGHAFNIGGGPLHTISLIELVDMISKLKKSPLEVKHENWRPSDQRYYVSNTRKFKSFTGWSPRVGLERGLYQLYEWLQSIQVQEDSDEGGTFFEASLNDF